jgi:O-antigen ligase/tetratricopeptide (TPR) repeat protein
VCSPALIDAFDLPKLAILKVGLTAVLLLLAWRGCVDAGVLRVPAAIAALVFVGAAGLAALTSLEPRTSILGNYLVHRGLSTLAVEVAWFVLAATWVRSEASLSRLASGFTVAGALTAIYVLLQAAGVDPLSWPPPPNDDRLTIGTLGYPNNVGEYLALTLPLTAWLAWRGKGTQRDLAAWALVVQLAGLWATQARVAWATVVLQAILIGPLLACACWRRARTVGMVLSLVPAVGALALFGTMLLAPTAASGAGPLGDRLLSGCPNGQCAYRGEPLATREALWRSALAMSWDRPLLGWGPDTFQLVYPGYRSTELDALDGAVARADVAHNVVLDTSTSTGILGTLAAVGVFVAVLAVLLRAAFGAATSSDRRIAAIALLLAWTSYVVLFTFGRARVATDWQTWVLGGAAIGLFAPRRTWTIQLATPARAALSIVGVVLVLDAGSAVLADAAVHAGDRGTTADNLDWRARAVALRPFEPSYQRRMGLALRALGKQTGELNSLDAAVSHLREASALGRDRDPNLLTELARVIEDRDAARGQVTGTALGFATRAIEVDPLSPLPYADAADLAFREQRADLATEYWEAARRRARTPDALRRLGEVALELGDTTSARIAFREGAAREWRAVNKLAAERAWGDVAMATGAPEEAAEAYAQLLQGNPGDLEARFNRAEALAAVGRRSEALAESQRASEQAPLDPRPTELANRLGQP